MTKTGRFLSLREIEMRVWLNDFFLHLMSIIIPGRIGCVCKFLLTGSHQIKWEMLTPPEQVWPGSQGDSPRDWRVFAHWVES